MTPAQFARLVEQRQTAERRMRLAFNRWDRLRAKEERAARRLEREGWEQAAKAATIPGKVDVRALEKLHADGTIRPPDVRCSQPSHCRVCGDPPAVDEPGPSRCPDCDANVTAPEGIRQCSNCGWSEEDDLPSILKPQAE